jgi:hypothetical protein
LQFPTLHSINVKMEKKENEGKKEHVKEEEHVRKEERKHVREEKERV